MKASAFRRWPVAGAYSPEQTTRLTGGSDSKYFSEMDFGEMDFGEIDFGEMDFSVLA